MIPPPADDPAGSPEGMGELGGLVCRPSQFWEPGVTTPRRQSFVYDDGMPKLYLFCGIAFSGKTTLARALAERCSCRAISLDDINVQRGLDGGSGMTPRQWKETHDLGLARACEILREGEDVVFDDTSSFRILRDKVRREVAAAGGETMLIFVDTAESVIRERLEKNRISIERNDVVPEVFEPHFATFERPSEAEEALAVDGARAPEENIDRIVDAAKG
jgi:predicted kinase